MEKIIYTGNIQAIQQLTHKSLSEIGEHVSILTKTGTMLELSGERVTSLIKDRRGIVAILNGEVIGFGAVTQIYPDNSREIGGITVNENHRGKQIGTHLFRRILRVEQRRNSTTGNRAKLFAFTNEGSYGIAVDHLQGSEETDPTTFHSDVLDLCKTCPKYANLSQGQICCDRPVVFPVVYISRRS
jgi:N-acetylglutamate synthase-like GNAT family acetyltransferase